MAPRHDEDREAAELRHDAEELAAGVLDQMRAAGLKLAVAESLTGGRLASTIVSVPGASDVFEGGAVTYSVAAKSALLGVDAGLLATNGAVNAEVATQMAVGAARVFGAQVAAATTGVAGPGPADGVEAGTAFIGIAAQGQDPVVREVRVKGSRDEVRSRVVLYALELLEAAVGQVPVAGEENVDDTWVAADPESI